MPSRNAVIQFSQVDAQDHQLGSLQQTLPNTYNSNWSLSARNRVRMAEAYSASCTRL